jgi:hypothetical protein
VVGAFRRNTAWYLPIFRTTPVGWGPVARRRVEQVLQNCDIYIQTLNDGFTNPSGSGDIKAGDPV